MKPVVHTAGGSELITRCHRLSRSLNREFNLIRMAQSSLLPAITWPNGKKFAFTVFDDTDFAEVENVGPVYALLRDLGMRTTKSVWPIKGAETPVCGGATCEDPEYLRWLKQLQRDGFEIGYHMATYHTSVRGQTKRGLDRFAELFGGPPKTLANHSACCENIYWGDARISGARRLAYNALTRFRHYRRFRGHMNGDPLYWADLCRERVTYVRNFVFDDINTLAACPMMPYHDPQKPEVNYWYASSEGPEIESFVRCISEANQGRLEAEGGACIMYTHFACGFVRDGAVNRRFVDLMTRLSCLAGWFVPVGELLDYIRQQRGDHTLTDRERRQLERRWLSHKLRVGAT